MKKMIVANWKMNPESLDQAKQKAREIAVIARETSGVEIIVCPPDLFLSDLSIFNSFILGAQNCSSEIAGAHTGEVSALMLADTGVKYVLVGHSERRAMGEGDEIINKKVITALRSRLKVILCVGEKVRDENGEYLNFISGQLRMGLARVSKKDLKNLIFAYEPIWAIGKEALRAASPADVLQTSIFIRRTIAELFGQDIAMRVPILYGGSVDKKNAEDFFKEGKVQGLLIGRESLNIPSFGEILHIANSL